jgi:hypothetical protein
MRTLKLYRLGQLAIEAVWVDLLSWSMRDSPAAVGGQPRVRRRQAQVSGLRLPRCEVLATAQQFIMLLGSGRWIAWADLVGVLVDLPCLRRALP